MAAGTAAGVPLGIMQLSPLRPLAWVAGLIISSSATRPGSCCCSCASCCCHSSSACSACGVPFPRLGEVGGWASALPAMANVAEIVRGAVAVGADGQWESSERPWLHPPPGDAADHPAAMPSSGMLPPWMNLYSLIAMSTVNASVVRRQRDADLDRAGATPPKGRGQNCWHRSIPSALVCFFLYAYPIGKWTERLERKYRWKD